MNLMKELATKIFLIIHLLIWLMLQQKKTKIWHIDVHKKLCNMIKKKEYDKAFNSYCRALRYLVPILDTLTASEERAYLQLKISEYLSRAEELKVSLYKEDNYKDKIKKHYSPEEQIADHEMSKVLMKKWENKGGKDITSLISSEEIIIGSDSPAISLSFASSGASFVSSLDSSQMEYVPSSSSSSSEQTVVASASSTDEVEALSNEAGSLDLKDLFGSIPKAKDALEIGQIGQMYMVQGDYKLALIKFESALGILIPLMKTLQSGFKRDLLMHQIKKWLTLAESAKTLASAKAIHCEEPLKSGVEVNGSYKLTSGVLVAVKFSLEFSFRVLYIYLVLVYYFLGNCCIQ